MIDDVCRVPIPFREPGRLQAVETFIVSLANQEEVRKIERIRLSLRIKPDSDRSIRVNRNFIQTDAVTVIGFDALVHGKFRSELDWCSLATANASEDVHHK